MPVFGKKTSKPDLTKKGSIDAQMKAKVTAREAEAARKAREATADAMQETAAALVMQRATRAHNASSTVEAKANKDIEEQQATHHSAPPPAHPGGTPTPSTPLPRALGSWPSGSPTRTSPGPNPPPTHPPTLISWPSCATSAAWTSSACAATALRVPMRRRTWQAKSPICRTLT